MWQGQKNFDYSLQQLSLLLLSLATFCRALFLEIKLETISLKSVTSKCTFHGFSTCPLRIFWTNPTAFLVLASVLCFRNWRVILQSFHEFVPYKNRNEVVSSLTAFEIHLKSYYANHCLVFFVTIIHLHFCLNLNILIISVDTKSTQN